MKMVKCSNKFCKREFPEDMGGSLCPICEEMYYDAMIEAKYFKEAIGECDL